MSINFCKETAYFMFIFLLQTKKTNAVQCVLSIHFEVSKFEANLPNMREFDTYYNHFYCIF